MTASCMVGTGKVIGGPGWVDKAWQGMAIGYRRSQSRQLLYYSTSPQRVGWPLGRNGPEARNN